MKICLKCNKEFKSSGIIDGTKKKFGNRKYCLECSPWGKHNTQPLIETGKIKEEISERRCSRCNEAKDISSFYRSGEKLLSICKECHKKLSKKLYDAKIASMDEYKANLGCSKCGDKRPYVLDFHHKDPQEKEFSISDKARASLVVLSKELEKCVCLCANCHREEHYLLKMEG
jgi:hypothetical protein